MLQCYINPTKLIGQNEKHQITGTYECGPQYHFPMETQTCVCIPIEDGMDVFSSTQWMDLTQTNVATVLDVPANRYTFYTFFISTENLKATSFLFEG